MNALFQEMMHRGKRLHQLKLGRFKDKFSQNEWMILNSLYEAENKKDVACEQMPHPGARHFADMMHCSPPMISKILRSLEEKEMILRSIDQKDRRNTKITLTEKGKEEIIRGRAVFEKYIDRVIEQMGEEKIRRMIQDMDDFYDISKAVIEEMNRADENEKA